jgi:TonB-linked SusC/RagA family outer membrane protein
MQKLLHNLKRNPLVTLLFILPALGFSQNLKVEGVVTDASDGRSIPGVSVAVANSTRGTITDFDGFYSLEASVNDTLVFSFIGYTTRRLVVGTASRMNVALNEEKTFLEEVVVVGYGTAVKKEITGAASSLKGEEITKLNMSRVDQALQGQLAGVVVNTNSGSPGGSASIRIRGLSTFGANDPLVLVDGVIYDVAGLNALNPEDIESINVLKDATAGIYGVRAANGVILIETKKGKANRKPQIEVSSFYGRQQTARRLPLLNATEYAVIKNNAFLNGGQTPPFNNTQLGEGTDWQDAVFQDAPISNLNFTISGGTDKSMYSIGATLFQQDGIVGGPKSSFTRGNVRINLAVKMSPKLTLNSVLLYTNEERRTLPENGIGSVLYNTVNAYPTEPLRQDDGRYSYLLLVNDIINPLAQMENTHNVGRANKFVGKEELVWTFNDNFSFTNRLNYNFALVDGRAFFPLAWYGPGKSPNTAINEDLDAPIVEIAPGVEIERGASVFQNRDTYTDLTFESFVNYNRTFNKVHRVKGMFGVSAFDRRGQGLNGIAFNIPNNSIEFADVSASQAPGGFLNNTGAFWFQERLLSAFARAEYSLHDKYLVSGIVRRDGSSRFGPNSRWGWFPALSGAWVFSEESFWNSKKIQFAKLRLSYGISGNDQIPNFAYRALLNGEGDYVFDDLITFGTAIGRAANPDLKWETTAQFNAGIDFTVGTAFNVSTNYFIKNTRDLLFQPDVSGLLGTAGAGGFAPFINAGDVRNTGVELELGYTTDPMKKSVFFANFNATYLQNKVLRVPDGVDFIPGAQFGVGGNVATRFQAGYPIGYFVGFETDGIFQNQAEIDNAPVRQEGARPGDLRFVDQDGDGVINFNDDSDRVFLGSPIPKFTFGLNLGGRHKNFDMSVNIFSAVGQKIIRNFERQQPYANQMNYIIDRWTGEGSTNEVPRVTTGPTRNNVFSDFFVEDGSFVRIRNLQVGYTLPRTFTNQIKVQTFRVYISINNLYTLTGYSGFDPDIGNFGGPLAAGVDYGFYPQARTFMGGFNIKF